MPAPHRSPTIEQFLYLVIFIIAVIARITHLGAAPLSDFEAEAALRALDVADGAPASLGIQPGYAALTGLLFSLFGSANFLARFLPALAGSALVFVPYRLRRTLGGTAGLALAAGLALDPGLVAASRLAGGPLPALACVLFAGVFWAQGAPAAAGIFGGLALLGGPAVWFGGLGVALAALLARWLGLWGEASRPGDAATPANPDHALARRRALAAGGAAVLLAGTLFLRHPQGLGAMAFSLPAFLSGWVTPSGVETARPFLALALVESLLVVFALAGAVRAWLNGQAAGQALSIWALVALTMLTAYAGRQVVDLVWALVPLWGLAALELGRLKLWQGGEVRQGAILAGILVALFASVRINLEALAYDVPGSDTYALRLWVVLGAVTLCLLAVALVGIGWGYEPAARGLVWGLGVVMLFGMLAGIWGVAHRDASARRDIWSPGLETGALGLLTATVDDLGEWEGSGGGVAITVLSDTPSVRWALRHYTNVTYASALPGGESPALILTAGNAPDLRLAAAYRGEGFVRAVRTYWDQMSADDWFRWWLFRSAPALHETVILWAHGGIFPSGADISLDSAFPLEVDPNAPSETVPEEEVDVNGNPVK